MNSTTDNNTSTFPATSTLFTGHQINQVARVIFATVGSVMIVCGFTGNALLVAVIFRRFQRKRYMHNLFIANLALADILTLGYWLTFFVLDLILGYHPVVNQTHCEVNGMAVGVLSVTSITTLLSISLNRYLHVCHSHLYTRNFTLRRTLLFCLFSWILGFILALPPLLGIGAGSYHYNHLTHICSFNRHKLSYSKIMVIVFSTVPMVFIGYWNFAIFRFWRKARISISSRYTLVCKEDEKAGKRSSRRERLRKGKEVDAQVDQEGEEGFKAVPCGRHNPEITVEYSSGSCGSNGKDNDSIQSHKSHNPEKIVENLSGSLDNNEKSNGVLCSDKRHHGDPVDALDDSPHSHASPIEDQEYDIETDTMERDRTVHDFCSVGKPCQVEKSEDGKGEVEDKRGEFEDEKGEVEDKKGEFEDEKGEAEDEKGEFEDEKGEAEDEKGEGEDEKGEGEDKRGEGEDKRGEGEDKRGEVEDEKGKGEDEKGEVEDEKGEGEDEKEDEKGEAGIKGQTNKKTHIELGKSPANGMVKGRQDSSPKLPCKNAGNDKDDAPTTTLSPASLKPLSSPSSPLSFIKSRSLSRRHKHHITTAMENLHQRRKKQKAREVAFVRSLFVVFILMFVSFIPYGITIVISSFVDVPPEVLILGIMLLFTNSSVNWIVYGVMNPAFRKGYIQCVRQILTTCCRLERERAEKYLNTSQSSLLTASVQRFQTDNDLDLSVVSQPTSGVL